MLDRNHPNRKIWLVESGMRDPLKNSDKSGVFLSRHILYEVWLETSGRKV